MGNKFSALFAPVIHGGFYELALKMAASINSVEVGSVVIPGDIVKFLSDVDDSTKIILGPGLRRDSDNVVTSKCGVLRKGQGNVYWVDCHQKRYIDVRGDDVLGVVTQKAGDLFKVDIGTSEQASLSYLAFEGATKKNRPRVNVGDLVFSRLLVASPYMEPELVCVDSYGKSSGMGVLEGGFMMKTSLNLVRKLRTEQFKDVLFATLKNLGIPFELVVGMNGRIWVKGRNVKQTIGVLNALLLCEHIDKSEVAGMCDRLAKALYSF